MTPRRLAYLGVFCLLSALVFYSFSRPGWESQFQATGRAMETASSWQLKVSGKPKGEPAFELQEEVRCPKDYHSVRHKEPAQGQPQSGQDIEVWVVTGKDAVQRWGDKLTVMQDRGWPPECGKKRLFELPGVPLYPVLMTAGHAVRGGKKSVAGVQCTVWTAQMPKGDGWGDVYDVCIDKNNFPLELVMKDGTLEAHASHWNEKFDLPQPPEVPPATQNNTGESQ